MLKLETDTQIAQYLEDNIGLRTVVKRDTNHLHVTLLRTKETSANYPKLTYTIEKLLRRSSELQSLRGMTIYGQLMGQSDYEWTGAVQLDELEIIQHSLQKELEFFKVNVSVKLKHKHLHILLTRPHTIEPDYPTYARLIRTNLRSLQLAHIEAFNLYGRLTGATEYEWTVTSRLDGQEDRDREGTTIHVPETKRRIIQQPGVAIAPKPSQSVNLWAVSGVGGGILIVILLILI